MADAVDLNVEKTNHRQVLGPGHLTEGYDRRRRPVASQELAQRQGAPDSVRIRVMLQKYMDFPFAADLADPFHLFTVNGAKELGSAKLLKNVREKERSHHGVDGAVGAVLVCHQRDHGQISVPLAQQLTNPALQVAIPNEHNRLVHVTQLEALVGLLFEQVALPHLSAEPFDPPDGCGIRDEKQDVRLFAGDVAHQMKQEIVFANCQVLHGARAPGAGVYCGRSGVTVDPSGG
jgi:hypothetical protein